MGTRTRIALGLTFLLVLVACGSESVQVAIGDITLTSIVWDGTPGPGCSVGAAGPFPTTPTEFAITGTGFSTVPGNTVEVEFRATGGARPFLGGHAGIVVVEATVVSDTQICGVTPSATICGVAAVTATVKVTLPSAVSDDSTTATQGPVFVATFSAPVASGLTATCFGSLTPTSVTILGWGFGSDGDPVTVRFVSAENVPDGDTIFSDGTTTSTEVSAVVSGGGTMITLSTPKVTNQIDPVPPGANPLHAVCDPMEDASVHIILWNGSCSLPGADPVIHFNAPEGDTIDAPSLAIPDFIPQTIATPFVITAILDAGCADAFGPDGGAVQVSFSAPGFPSSPSNAFQLDASGAGTDDFDLVNAEIISATEIRGMTPVCLANVNFVPVVRIHFEDGMVVPVDTAFTWEAPPIVTGVTNLIAGTGNGLRLTLPTTDFVGSTADMAQIDGASFANPNLTGIPVVAVYDKNTGIGLRLGTGNPAQMPAGNDLGPTYAATDTQITGETRIVPDLAALDTDGNGVVEAVVRVTAADGQFGEFDVNFLTMDPGANVSQDATSTNNNTSITVDPTSVTDDFGVSLWDATPGANLAVVAGDDPLPGPGVFLFQGQRVFISTSVDGGVSWTNGTLGTAEDGFGALEFRNFAMTAYDHLGNLWVSYLVDDLATLTSNVVLLVSFDQGQSFNDVSDPSIQGYFFGALDRPALAVGPAGNPLVTSDSAACVSYVDLMPAVVNPGVEVLCAGRLATGLGTTGAFAPPVVANDLVYGGAYLLQHARSAIGPNGEFYVTWNDFSFSTPAPAWLMVFDRDLDGLFGATFAFDDDAFIDMISLPATPRASTPDFGPPVPETDICVVPTGTYKGRVVVAYEGVLPGMGGTINPDVTQVVTQSSDAFGYSWNAMMRVHAVDDGDHYLPALCADPLTGRVYITWNDTSMDPLHAMIWRYSAASADGASWGSPLLLSTSPSVAPGSDLEYSDYGIQSGVTALGGWIYAAWAETPGATPTVRKDVFVRGYQQATD